MTLECEDKAIAVEELESDKQTLREKLLKQKKLLAEFRQDVIRKQDKILELDASAITVTSDKDAMQAKLGKALKKMRQGVAERKRLLEEAQSLRLANEALKATNSAQATELNEVNLTLADSKNRNTSLLSRVLGMHHAQDELKVNA